MKTPAVPVRHQIGGIHGAQAGCEIVPQGREKTFRASGTIGRANGAGDDVASQDDVVDDGGRVVDGGGILSERVERGVDVSRFWF